MKLAKRILFGAMAALALVGCKDDPMIQGENPNSQPEFNGPGVYFALQIDLPNARGSRSETVDPGDNGDNGSASNGGVEIGKDYENAVNEAIIVLADAHANEFIAAAQVTAGNLYVQANDKSSYLAKSKFSKQELSSYYDMLENRNADWKDATSPLKTNIFVFCNPTQNLRAKLLGDVVNGQIVKAPEQGKTDWLMETGKILTPTSVTGDGTSSIWAREAFLMTNALIATRELPANITGWNAFTSEDTPFSLSDSNTLGTTGEDGKHDIIDNSDNAGRGPIKVERACARFDFRDGAQLGNFTYDVLKVEENGIPTEHVLVQVHLQKMFLVNQSNTYYYLPRTVAPLNGEDGDGATIVGVDPDELLKGICKPEKRWIFDGNGGYIKPYGNYVADYNITWKNQVYLDWKDNDSEGDKDDEDTSGAIGTVASNFDQYFNYPFFNNDGTIDNTDILGNRWTMYLCSEVVSGEIDNIDETDPGRPNLNVSGDYRIWCYTTENTIPSIEGQINGVSTGVVFKAKFSSPDITGKTEDENTLAVAAALNKEGEETADDKDPIIFMYDNILYCGWDNIREAAIKAADPQFVYIKEGEELENGVLVVKGHWELRYIDRTVGLYRAVFGKGGIGEDFTFKYIDDADGKEKEGTVKETLAPDETSANYLYNKWAEFGCPDGDGVNGEAKAAKDAFKAAATDKLITIYQRSLDGNFGWGYYCYYYYWNRHNDNGFNGIMGPMEFAVVRNNVYKLAVTEIKKLGHPRISENDPHKPGPGTPDEDESVYIKVTSEVLPWVVRVNNIEF